MHIKLDLLPFHIKLLVMYHHPVVLDVDHNFSDPLNPAVNYTHFHPFVEQQYPCVPLHSWNRLLSGIPCVSLASCHVCYLECIDPLLLEVLENRSK